MKVALIDVDSHHFPNLALMKISAYWKSEGAEVEWCVPIKQYDVAYASKIFDFTPNIDFEPQADCKWYGGTGYGTLIQLPTEIENIMPDYELYGITDTAYGFITRGCPRNCDFCIVTSKEGHCTRQVAEVSQFWSGQNHICVMDSNILACDYRYDLLKSLIDTGAKIDFNQGLDIRYVDDDVIDLLNRMRLPRVRFAWDNPKEDLEPLFRRFTEKYKRKSPDMKVVYVLTNFNSTFAEDLERVEILKDAGYDPYVMVYNKGYAPREVRRL